LVFGIGNPSRGDDALGFRFAEELAAWLEVPGNAASLPMEVTVETDFQLLVEHALDLRFVDGAVFIDASMDTGAPFTVTRLSPIWDDSHTTHSLSPSGVLGVARKLGQTVPPCWQLAIPGHGFELGDDLSDAAAHSLFVAVDATLRALADGGQPLFI
jgi:hydrogenase maturation protease